METKVVKNQIEKAMRDFKRKTIREGLFKELGKRRFYTKPSVKAKLKREEAEKRRSRDRRRAYNRSINN